VRPKIRVRRVNDELMTPEGVCAPDVVRNVCKIGEVEMNFVKAIPRIRGGIFKHPSFVFTPHISQRRDDMR